MAAILSGIYALFGAAAAWKLIYFNDEILYEQIQLGNYQGDAKWLLVIAVVVFTLALVTTIILSHLKAKKAGDHLMNASARRVMFNFMLPLTAGGIFVLILIFRHHTMLIAPATLIFYGLALFIAGNFTFSDIRTLGIAEIITGLVCACFPGLGLYFWAFGFGILHIVYGIIMYYKYEV
jgi:hypothetical protein